MSKNECDIAYDSRYLLNIRDEIIYFEGIFNLAKII